MIAAFTYRFACSILIPIVEKSRRGHIFLEYGIWWDTTRDRCRQENWVNGAGSVEFGCLILEISHIVFYQY